MNDSAYSPYKAAMHPDSLALLRKGRQPAPKQVQLILSDLCNQGCAFCAYRMKGNTSNQLFGEGNPKRMIPFEKVEEILADCAGMGVQAIQFTGGGEPTVHPHHAEAFTACADIGLGFSLVTNGRLMRPETAEALEEADWVRVSVDAGVAATYAKVRRARESDFHAVWENIASLAPRVDNLGVGFVVTPDNYGEVSIAAKRARDAGAANIRISAQFSPQGADLFFDCYSAAREAALDAEERYNTDSFRVFNLLGDRLRDLSLQSPDYEFCGVQHFNTYVGADLNVYRCCVYAYNERGLLGSVADRTFMDLWYSDEKYAAMARFDATGCERCQFNNKNRFIRDLVFMDERHAAYV